MKVLKKVKDVPPIVLWMGSMETTATERYLKPLDKKRYFMKLKKKYKNEPKTYKRMKRAIRRMAREDEKGEGADMGILRHYMDSTYPIRHSNAWYDVISVSQLVTLFPGLKYLEELRREYRRMQNVKIRMFERKVKKLLLKEAASVVAWPKRKLPQNEVVQNAVTLFKFSETPMEEKQVLAALLYCVKKADPVFIETLIVPSNIGELKQPSSFRYQPSLELVGSGLLNESKVYCEKMPMIRSMNMLDGLFAVYYYFWAFNLMYTEHVDQKIFQPWDDIAVKLRNAHD